ncbi:MAG TPA: hypothetical protein VGX24_05395 [Pyrinomonadaceae bacterium]|jgi:hypothetical protein|nr:hypothetical protein [Pyrinomonadaceae bacterium]
MSRGFLSVGLMIALFVVAQAQQQGRRKVEQLLAGQIKFTLTEEFRPVRKKTADFKFAVKTPKYDPSVSLSERIYAYADESRGLSLTFSFFGAEELGSRANAVGAPLLPELKKLLEASLARNVPGIEWRKRELTEVGGRKWIHLSFKAKEGATSKLYDMRLTDYQGFMLAFSLDANEVLYEKHFEVASDIVKSLDVKPHILLPPAGATRSRSYE